jgi:hypothetical protein
MVAQRKVVWGQPLLESWTETRRHREGSAIFFLLPSAPQTVSHCLALKPEDQGAWVTPSAKLWFPGQEEDGAGSRR